MCRYNILIMTHYFEKTIVDAKTIYTDYLLNVLSPIIYFGLKHIYKDAQNMEAQIVEAEKVNPSIKNPGVLILFQHFISALDKWTDATVEQETNRIRSASGCADIFDDLIRAVIKSHIIVLTYTASKKTCKIVQERLHEKVEIKAFIHCCYLECGKIFYDHPTLFYHDFSNSELKENERKIYQLIKIGIKNGIKRVLPMKQILNEYLSNDYIEVDEEDQKESYMKIKDLLQRDNEDEGGRMKLIDSETSIDHNLGKIESLIYGRNVDDTIDVEIIKDELLKEEHKHEQTEKIEKEENIINPINENIHNNQNDQNQIIENDANKIVTSLRENNNEQDDKLNQSKFENVFSSKGSKKKIISNIIIDDAIKSIKNEKDNEIKIERSAVNNANDNDNYFGEII